MHKRFFTLLILITTLIGKSWAQTPPTLLNYYDSAGANYMLLHITFTPRDTGVIKAQVQLQQGTGNTVYDSTYTLHALSATATDSAVLVVGPIFSCANFNLLFNLSNDSVQGDVFNPLLTFTTICTGLDELSQNNFKAIVSGRQVQIISSSVPANSVAEIYNIAGQKIEAINIEHSTENIWLHQANGIYLLRIASEGQTVYSSRLAVF
jgi:hypothetical protein